MSDINKPVPPLPGQEYTPEEIAAQQAAIQRAAAEHYAARQAAAAQQQQIAAQQAAQYGYPPPAAVAYPPGATSYPPQAAPPEYAAQGYAGSQAYAVDEKSSHSHHSHHGDHSSHGGHSHKSDHSHSHKSEHSHHDTHHETDEPNSRWLKAYTSARHRLPPSLSSRLPTSEQAQASVDSLSAKMSGLASSTSASVDKSQESLKLRKARLRSDLLSHGYSVANATQIPLYISLNQVGPLMYDAVEPNGVFERRCPGLFFFLEVRASGGPYTPWSVAWPILAVTGPAVALTSLLAIPMAAAMTGSAALAGVGTAVMSGITTATTAVTAAGTTIATTAARIALLPGGKKLHSKLVEAANSNIALVKKKGKQEVLRYVTVAVSSLMGRKQAEAVAKQSNDPLPAPEILAEVDVTGYPLEKVLVCKTGKRKVDEALEKAFKKLDFKTRDFQPKTDPVLRVVGGPVLEQRGHKQILVFHPLQLQHIIDLKAEPLSADQAPPTEEEERLVQDAKLVDTWEEASVTSEDAPPHAGHDEDPKKRSWLDSWRSRRPTPTASPK